VFYCSSPDDSSVLLPISGMALGVVILLLVICRGWS
jgi:hypothetical protein